MALAPAAFDCACDLSARRSLFLLRPFGASAIVGSVHESRRLGLGQILPFRNALQERAFVQCLVADVRLLAFVGYSVEPGSICEADIRTSAINDRLGWRATVRLVDRNEQEAPAEDMLRGRKETASPTLPERNDYAGSHRAWPLVAAGNGDIIRRWQSSCPI